MKDIMGMMKQLGQMQSKMQQMQEELAQAEIPGQSGGGLVAVTLDGKASLKRIRIDPSLMKADEVEILEDLIIAAVQDAKVKVEETLAEKMQSVTGGLPLPPGLKLF
ncbi:MAG: YbaB/EbfC family nucleoid-associated protein [Hyphomicrobiaceae bacterium]